MKRIFLVFIFLVSSVFANESIFNSVIKNVSIPDTQKTIDDAKKLQANLTNSNFKEFIKSWKKVEAIYLAGEIDSDYLDTPRYIDVFNNLKEDLNSQMQRVIESKSDVKTALFKNSFKTVNALEYVLFSSQKMNDRQIEISKEILNSIISKLEEIKEVYESYLKNSDGEEDEVEYNAKLINTLIASTYRLKEWRIGNPGGFSVKYKNDAKNNRAEYFLSQSSFDAIDAILDAQKELISNQKYSNLINLAKSKNAASDLELVSLKIDEAKKELKNLKKDDFSDSKKLFDLSSQIHDLYYITIIEKLGLKPNILDADGD
ncbi:imelysin family protein [Aliarcobacter lanthieri]|uniref:imelysin family protein n=1 Tax=Aliarcobacter lanthieri TaxID=1355374 RepID=UPI001A910D1F|nr:imelysin family protein [Aliarcobacter lanthieri]